MSDHWRAETSPKRAPGERHREEQRVPVGLVLPQVGEDPSQVLGLEPVADRGCLRKRAHPSAGVSGQPELCLRVPQQRTKQPQPRVDGAGLALLGIAPPEDVLRRDGVDVVVPQRGQDVLVEGDRVLLPRRGLKSGNLPTHPRARVFAKAKTVLWGRAARQQAGTKQLPLGARFGHAGGGNHFLLILSLPRLRIVPSHSHSIATR